MKEIITDIQKLNDIGRCEEVDLLENSEEVKSTAKEIKKTLRKNKLTALSAPAIGENKRIFCIMFSDTDVKTFINPVISYEEDMQLSREVCSSLPGKEYIIPRRKVIDLTYQTIHGNIRVDRFKGLAACVFQHEMDHLNGITLQDIGLEIEEDFDNATEEQQQSVIDLYLNSIEDKKEDIEKEIDSDEELSLISERLRFTEALARGEITLEKID